MVNTYKHQASNQGIPCIQQSSGTMRPARSWIIVCAGEAGVAGRGPYAGCCLDQHDSKHLQTVSIRHHRVHSKHAAHTRITTPVSKCLILCVFCVSVHTLLSRESSCCHGAGAASNSGYRQHYGCTLLTKNIKPSLVIMVAIKLRERTHQGDASN